MKKRLVAILMVVCLSFSVLTAHAASDFSSDRVLGQTETAGDDYFKSTLFIGDSRMQGLELACSSESSATFYTAVSVTASQIDTRAGVSVTVNGATKNMTIIDAIKQDGRQFKRVYMMFGINELGSGGGTNAIIKGYRSAIEKVRAVQPSAQICIMGVMPVFNSCSYVSGYTGDVANPKILALNEALVALAEEVDAYYLDTYHLFAASDGQLRSDVSKDGIHLYSSASRQMMEYVKTHAIPKKGGAYTPGDLNGDGAVNTRDAVMMAQYLANWSISVNLSAADCNGDGSVSASDCVLLAQYLSGWDVELG